MKPVKILDPAREEFRDWKAKKLGLEKKRMRSAAILQCQFCGSAIGPDMILSDIGGKRACPDCVRKDI